MSQLKIKVCGILIKPGSPLNAIVPRNPGVWDHEGCGSTRHMVRLLDGRLFDLGCAGSTKHLCHIIADGHDTFLHHPVEQLEIITPPDDIPEDKRHEWQRDWNGKSTRG
ncbi:MAG: hypothetical protein WCW66_02155 [Patescibacteria group bacterium]